MDIYIVKAEDGESRTGATLNLWACMGSTNDDEAQKLLVTIQQSIQKVIEQATTTTLDTSFTLLSLSSDMSSDRHNDVHNGIHKQQQQQQQQEEEEEEEVSKREDEGNKKDQLKPYQIQLSRFALKRLTLHAPALVGLTAPPMVLTGIELTDVSTATGLVFLLT